MQNELSRRMAPAAQKVERKLGVNQLLNNDLVLVAFARPPVFHREMLRVSRLRVDDARWSMGASAPSRRRRGFWGWGKFHDQVSETRNGSLFHEVANVARRKTSCPRRHAFSRSAC